MHQFSQYAISANLLTALNKLKLTNATPIQHMSIPLALNGRDLLGTAQTGTGKTFAFGIPLINHLIKSIDNAAIRDNLSFLSESGRVQPECNHLDL